jgi:hypothetical protein
MDSSSWALIVLGFFVFVYILVFALLFWRQNPSANTSDPDTESTVTYTYLGKRGDMGNQIFEIAVLLAAGRRSQAKVVLPTQVQSLPLNALFDLSSVEWKDITPDVAYSEYSNHEIIQVPADGRTYDIYGYRQSYLYFEDYAEEVRRLFTPRVEILEAVRSILPSAYIAVHIRRGDYIKAIHSVPLLREFRRCQLDYYKGGIKKLRELYPEHPLLICTDSPAWVKPLLPELDPHAELAPVPEGVDPKFSDFCTLYLANALVMSNSSYSFWAAYLQTDRLVIAPTPWWDPDGFIGTALALDSPHLHHPDWWLLDADTGVVVRTPHSKTGERPDNDGETLSLYRVIRGLIV